MKPLLFAPCEKVLDDVRQGSSLISVFHGIKFQLLEGQELPPDAVVPKEWAIFSKWDLMPEEEGREYMSRLDIFWPDGRPFARHELIANQPTRFGMSFVHRFNGFPIGQAGSLRILTSILSGEAVIVGPVEIPIQVDILPVDKAADAEPSV